MFKKFITAFFCLAILTVPVLADTANNPQVLLSTNMGEIVLELDKQKAPITVENFLNYVNSDFYNGTIFHRVIANFIVQGGGFTENMTRRSTLAPINNEADNGLANKRGTIAMARTNNINSATSQFFINVSNNDFLNHNEHEFGYAVFGKVIHGMDIVDNIARVPTTSKAGAENTPIQPIVILSAKQLQ